MNKEESRNEYLNNWIDESIEFNNDSFDEIMRKSKKNS